MADALEPGIANLLASLQERGYEMVRDETHNESFGDRLLDLTNDSHPTAKGVVLTRDRGLWSVELQVGTRCEPVWRLWLALTDTPLEGATLPGSPEDWNRVTLEVIDRLPLPGAKLDALLKDSERLGAEFVRNYRLAR